MTALHYIILRYYTATTHSHAAWLSGLTVGASSVGSTGRGLRGVCSKREAQVFAPSSSGATGVAPKVQP